MYQNFIVKLYSPKKTNLFDSKFRSIQYVYLFTCTNIILPIGGGVSSGIILQRFPEKDWPDTSFIEGIEWVKRYFSQRDIYYWIIDLHRNFLIVVLSTARMGFVDREARTTLLCLDIDGYRCKPTLLRLYVFQ